MLIARVFGDNLRELCARRSSIAGVARDLGIGKVQFYRYLSGQSYPKPKVLKDICTYFDVDARIMTEPLDSIFDYQDHSLDVSEGPGEVQLKEGELEDGFYLRTVISQRRPNMVFRTLWQVKTGLKGKEIAWRVPHKVHKEANHAFYIPPKRHEGHVKKVENGLYSVILQHATGTVFFEFWKPDPFNPSGIWSGMSIYASVEKAWLNRAVRSILAPVGTSNAEILQAARSTGYLSADDLRPEEKLMLQPGHGFQ